MGPSICKNVAVEYHGENTPLYFDIPSEVAKDQDFTKAPAMITLTLTLEEMFVITKEELTFDKR